MQGVRSFTPAETFLFIFYLIVLNLAMEPLPGKWIKEKNMDSDVCGQNDLFIPIFSGKIELIGFNFTSLVISIKQPR